MIQATTLKRKRQGGRLTDGDDLAELELVEDGDFTGGVEADHEDPHLLLGEEPAEELPEREPHLPPSSAAGPPFLHHLHNRQPFIDPFIPRAQISHPPPQTLATQRIASHHPGASRPGDDGAADLNRPDPGNNRAGRSGRSRAGERRSTPERGQRDLRARGVLRSGSAEGEGEGEGEGGKGVDRGLTCAAC